MDESTKPRQRNGLSRTAVLRAGYLCVFGALLVLAAWILVRTEYDLATAPVVILLLLLPGRIQGALLRDLLVGRRLLDAGRPAESLAATQQFLELVRRQPWRNRLLWLSWSLYTTSAEAMALNNAGVAHMQMGDGAAARESLRSALRVDSLYPLPYFNLAILASAAGDSAEAVKLATEARRLGYSRSTGDVLASEGQRLLAGIEGRSRG